MLILRVSRLTMVMVPRFIPMPSANRCNTGLTTSRNSRLLSKVWEISTRKLSSLRTRHNSASVPQPWEQDGPVPSVAHDARLTSKQVFMKTVREPIKQWDAKQEKQSAAGKITGPG